jgi:hypothetical protein
LVLFGCIEIAKRPFTREQHVYRRRTSNMARAYAMGSKAELYRRRKLFHA